MRNDEREEELRRAESDPEAAPLPPLLILASDEDLVCVDDLCLPAEPGE